MNCYGGDFDEYCRRQAVTWAAGTIANLAPHLELRVTTPGYWDVWWRAEEGLEAIQHDHWQNLDWRGLVEFAHSIVANRMTEQA